MLTQKMSTESRGASCTARRRLHALRVVGVRGLGRRASGGPMIARVQRAAALSLLLGLFMLGLSAYEASRADAFVAQPSQELLDHAAHVIANNAPKVLDI